MTSAVASVGTTISIGGTQIDKVISIKGPDIAKEQIDVTNLDSGNKEYIGGFIDAGSVSFDLYWTKSASQVALRDSFLNRTSSSYIISLNGGGTVQFSAIVDKFAMSFEADGIKASVNLKLSSVSFLPTAPPAAAWNELTGTSIGLDGANERSDSEATYVISSADGTGSMVFGFVSDVHFEPNGLLVAPGRPTYTLQTLAPQTSWTGTNCSGNSGGGDTNPAGATSARAVAAASFTGECSLRQTQTGMLTSGSSHRVVLSIVGKQRAGSDIRYVGLQLTTSGGSAGARFDWQEKDADFSHTESGHLSVHRSYFEQQEYGGFYRAVMVVDVSSSNTDANPVFKIYFSNASGVVLASLDGDDFNWYHAQAELAGTQGASFPADYSGDWGSFAGPMIGTTTVSPRTRTTDRFTWPWTAVSASAGFSDTATDTADDGTPIQTKGAYYVEFTPKADARYFGGFPEGFSLSDNFKSAIIGANTDEGGADAKFDAVRSTYLALNADQDGDGVVSSVEDGFYTKATNRDVDAGYSVEAYTVSGQAYLPTEGQLTRIVVVYSDEDTPVGQTGGYCKLFINGNLVDTLEGFRCWGNGNGDVDQSGAWNVPGGTNMGLVLGAHNRGDGVTSCGTNYINVSEISWWDEVLTDAQAEYMSQNGIDAWS